MSSVLPRVRKKLHCDRSFDKIRKKTQKGKCLPACLRSTIESDDVSTSADPYLTRGVYADTKLGRRTNSRTKTMNDERLAAIEQELHKTRQELGDTRPKLGESRQERGEEVETAQGRAKRMQYLLVNFATKLYTFSVSRNQDAQSQGGHKQGVETAHSTSRIQDCAGRSMRGSS